VRSECDGYSLLLNAPLLAGPFKVPISQGISVSGPNFPEEPTIHDYFIAVASFSRAHCGTLTFVFICHFIFPSFQFCPQGKALGQALPAYLLHQANRH